MPIVSFLGKTIYFPDDMGAEEISDVVGGIHAATQAVNEVIITMARGAVSEPIAGWTALATGDPDAVEGMMSRMSYQPKTVAGRRAMERIANTMQLAAQTAGLDHAPGYWRDRVVPALQEYAGATGGAVLGAGALAAMVGMMEMGGGKGAPRGFGASQRGGLGDTGLSMVRRDLQGDSRNLAMERSEHRGARVEGSRGMLSPAEKQAIEKSAMILEGDPKAAMKLARDWKKRHPSSEWEQVEISGVEMTDSGDFSLKLKQVPYKFNLDPRTGKQAPRGSAHYEKIVGGVTDEILDIAKRAKEGDPSAMRVMDHAGWYKNVERRLKTEYGSFSQMMGDVMGATSPNTPVGTNFNFSKDILKRSTRGDFDAQMDGFADSLDRRYSLEDAADRYLIDQKAAGRTKKAAAGDPEYTDMVAEAKQISLDLRDATNTIKQESGKNYGINSYNTMIALADKWRELRPGGAPKARNFSGNLTGSSNKGTIDVWAARNLRRHAGAKPIPSAAEGGVKGKIIDAEEFINDGEFGFGQDVLQDATQRINQRLGMDLDPRDLQALQWFAEKDYWTKRGWTSATGEGGSFETMMDVDPVNSTFLGLSREQNLEYQGVDFIPTPEQNAMAARGIVGQGLTDPDVRAVKGNATTGKYMDSPESALDVDVVTSRDQIPTSILDGAVDQAVMDKQDSFFIANRIDDHLGASNPEAFSVGTEVYFKEPLRAESPSIKSIQEDLNAQGIPAYTLITDPRDANKITGLRYLDIPQFYDPDKFAKMSTPDYKNHVLETYGKFNEVGEYLKYRFPEIKSAEPAYFDINVKSRKQASDYAAQRANPERDPDVLHQEFFGYKPPLTRYKEFTGEARPYYSEDGLRIDGSEEPRIIPPIGLGGQGL